MRAGSVAASFHFNVPVGQWAELDGDLVRFKGRARDRERSLLFEGVDGVPHPMTDARLLALQQGAERRVRLLTSQEAAERLEPEGKPRVRLSSDDLGAGAEARRKHDYCRAWVRAGRPARSASGLPPVIEGEFERRRLEPSDGQVAEAAAPSVRRVQRWIADWLAGGEDIDMLVPQTSRRGNSVDRLHPKAREILTEVIDERYLVTTKPTAVAVHKHVVAAFDAYNEPLTGEDRLPVPSLRSVYRSIRSIDQYTQLCTRVGRRAADVKYRNTGSSPQTDRHNEVWEIDHTTVDLIVVDNQSGMPIGRPTVTVTLDRHTRMITGFHIGFDPPGTFPTMECLRNAILPKDDLVRGLSVPWPCMGTPETLVPDQGKEFKARSFIEANLSLGIDVQYTPVLKAWYKGKIERFFRTLSTDVFHRVPGTTFSDIFDRNKEEAPETVAVATLDDLRRHVLRHVVEVYHVRRHRGIGVSPLEAWNRSVEIHGMRPVPNPDKVTAALSLVVYRKPQHYGIEFEGLVYNSVAVAALRIGSAKSETVRLSIDPRNLCEIRFLDPDEMEWRTVPIQTSMAAHVRGISLEKHKLARALQRANPIRLEGSKGLLRAYTMLDDVMREKSGQSGQANRKKAARYWQALTASKPPEDPPAFDVAESGRSLVADLYTSGASGDADHEEPVVDGEVEEPARPAPDPAPPAEIGRKRRRDPPKSQTSTEPGSDSVPTAPPPSEPDAADDDIQMPRVTTR